MRIVYIAGIIIVLLIILLIIIGIGFDKAIDNKIKIMELEDKFSDFDKSLNRIENKVNFLSAKNDASLESLKNIEAYLKSLL